MLRPAPRVAFAWPSAWVVIWAVVWAPGCASNPAPVDAPASAWRQGPAMPRKALAPGVAAFGQLVVVAGGFDSGPAEGLDITAEVDAFDTTTTTTTAAGAWGRLPDLPVRWTDSNLATVGDALYLLGGLEGTARVARGDAFILDPLLHTWQPIAAMDPVDARGAAGVVAAPGHIYLLGGASSTGPLASCLDYEIATGRWSPAGPDLPAPRAHPAAMRRSDGTLVVAGGFASLDASAPRGEVWTLPPPGAASRTWQLSPAMHPPGAPAARGGCAYGVVLGQLVCAGGEVGPAAQDAVESYDPYNAVWATGEAMPVARAGVQGAAVGARLYVPGGATSADLEPTDTLYVYAPLDTAPR